MSGRARVELAFRPGRLASCESRVLVYVVDCKNAPHNDSGRQTPKDCLGRAVSPLTDSGLNSTIPPVPAVWPTRTSPQGGRRRARGSGSGPGGAACPTARACAKGGSAVGVACPKLGDDAAEKCPCSGDKSPCSAQKVPCSCAKRSLLIPRRRARKRRRSERLAALFSRSLRRRPTRPSSQKSPAFQGLMIFHFSGAIFYAILIDMETARTECMNLPASAEKMAKMRLTV